MENKLDDLIRRINAEHNPAITESELRLLEQYTTLITEYQLLCGTLYKFNNTQLRLL
jgi:hypothetical protein